MRKLACLLLLIAIAGAQAASGLAATNVTVSELDQMLARLRQERDGKAASEITGLKLTERANSAWLAKWESGLKGDRAREALMAVVDASAFLDPPAAERPALAVPDTAAQQQMVARTTEYVRQTLRGMPNFFALRTTSAFAVGTEEKLDSAQLTNSLMQKQRGPKFEWKALGPGTSGHGGEPQLFWLGTAAQQVAYRGGFEEADSAANSGATSSNLLMTTVGEFGSVLELFLVDIEPDKLIWDHWEQGAAGPLAVFRYSVPGERSHFGYDAPDRQHEHPAYHGEVAINAVDGSIWRITILASSSEPGFVDESSILVEFSPTEIGRVSYVCPVRGVAMLRYFDTFEYANTLHTPVPYQTFLNDVSFTKYLLLRSESRIVPGASKP